MNNTTQNESVNLPPKTLEEFILRTKVTDRIQEVDLELIWEDGSTKVPATFKLRALSGEEIDEANSHGLKISHGADIIISQNLLNAHMLAKSCIEPDFNQSKWIEKAGCVTAEELILQALNSETLTTLGKVIQGLSGNKTLNQLVKEAKK